MALYPLIQPLSQVSSRLGTVLVKCALISYSNLDMLSYMLLYLIISTMYSCRIVKLSSPYLNLLMISGAILYYVVVIMFGLDVDLVDFTTVDIVRCQVRTCSFYKEMFFDSLSTFEILHAKIVQMSSHGKMETRQRDCFASHYSDLCYST